MLQLVILRVLFKALAEYLSSFSVLELILFIAVALFMAILVFAVFATNCGMKPWPRKKS